MSCPPRSGKSGPAFAVAALLLSAAATPLFGGPRAAFAEAMPAKGSRKTVVISPELSVSIADGDEVVLSARPLPGEGVNSFVQRLTESAKTKREIFAQSAGTRLLRKDVFVSVPYRLLSENYRKIAMEALFPEDRADARGWNHRVTGLAGKPESLWRIAEWFTGNGANYRDIRIAGEIRSLQTEKGQTVRIPAALLSPAFRGEAEAAAAAPPPPLEFQKDEKGRYAVYRLRRGEALYSAVVVRFTGRLHAEDVNAKAAEIAERSEIADVHAIPVGFPVKIPVEDLAAEFRPRDDPARVAEEKSRLEVAQFVNRVRAADLSGVTFVLDAGHGGRDTGALVEGVAEARYVYDLACRVERLLARNTRARVVMTVRPDAPCVGRNAPPGDFRTAKVMTTPPYPLEDATTGVNFRWYLANSVLKNVKKHGGSEEKTVFVSIHADSLHPAVRGAMVYIPGEKYLKGSFGKSGEIYAARREVREAPQVSFSRKQRVRAEGVSRDLAEKIVATFRKAGLPLHEFAPIRRNVIRGGREWVPAILRYNRIPARVLLEVCNLNNPEDRKLLITRSYREKVARSLVTALVAFYGGEGRDVLSASAKEDGPQS
jgi:N-acetylmuramoyl-L-alanine amidase